MSEHELTCGLEIHQQLDTKKLFCDCPTSLVEEEGATFQRRLRPTTSELGEIDRAALVQAEKRMRFRYQAPPPPHVLWMRTRNPLTAPTMRPWTSC